MPVFFPLNIYTELKCMSKKSYPYIFDKYPYKDWRQDILDLQHIYLFLEYILTAGIRGEKKDGGGQQEEAERGGAGDTGSRARDQGGLQIVQVVSQSASQLFSAEDSGDYR